MKNQELCIGADALESTGTAPQPGDEVTVTIKGRVTRAEGGQVYLQPETANGRPIAPTDNPGEPSEAQLRDMAATADQEEG